MPVVIYPENLSERVEICRTKKLGKFCESLCFFKKVCYNFIKCIVMHSKQVVKASAEKRYGARNTNEKINNGSFNLNIFIPGARLIAASPNGFDERKYSFRKQSPCGGKRFRRSDLNRHIFADELSSVLQTRQSLCHLPLRRRRGHVRGDFARRRDRNLQILRGNRQRTVPLDKNRRRVVDRRSVDCKI